MKGMDDNGNGNCNVNENKVSGVYSAEALGFNSYTNYATVIRFSDSYFDN